MKKILVLSLVAFTTGLMAQNVGIGTVTPGAKLEVVGNTTTTGNAFEVKDSAGVSRVVVKDGGRVGVGTATPAAKLEVVGNTTSTGTPFEIKDSAGVSRVVVKDAGKVGINNATPDVSSSLDVVSTTSGVLIPRMTTAQYTAIANPATGLLVYSTSNNRFYYYNGTQWVSLISIVGGGNTVTGDPTLVYTVDGF